MVTIAAAEVPRLIQLLDKEQIYITSCTPELNMEKLFETNA
jgi:ABC-2 type transport system ATP-binding protein